MVGRPLATAMLCRSLAAALLALVALPAAAQAPRLVPYQGTLTDGGVPVTAATPVTFRLFEAATGGAALWTETQTVAPDATGTFSVRLGSDTGLDITFDRPLWLEVEVGGTVLGPRTALGVAPYALGLYGLRVEAPTSANAAPNVVGGHPLNAATGSAVGATISGGGSGGAVPAPNTVTTPYGAVGGGVGNTVSGSYGTVGGGSGNTAATNAAVGGGQNNQAMSSWSAVGGGVSNRATAANAAVVGGASNTASGSHGAVGGGKQNTASGDFAVVAGGEGNTAVGTGASIGGGSGNVTDAATTAGGVLGYPTIGGGIENHAIETGSTVAGGERNRARGLYGTVGGGFGNDALDLYATVSGGRGNEAARYAFIGGGSDNDAGAGSVVSGGVYNNAASGYSVIGGGERNSIPLTCAGCLHNVIGGGAWNRASRGYTVVGGGEYNQASGAHATVPGGYGNHARGVFSFAAGRLARAVHNATFVWADWDAGTPNDSLLSTGSNQFLIRARGGVGIGTNAPRATLHVARGDLPVQPSATLNEGVLVEHDDAVVGLYSNGVGLWGSALALGEVDGAGALVNKWAVVRGTGGGGLHFTHGTSANYGANNTVMRIDTDGTVHVDASFTGGGADLAEFFPLADGARVAAGQVVGLRAGRASLATDGAEQVLVASSDPAFVGNPDAAEGGALLALVGQAEVRLAAGLEARPGDLLVASGASDGTARPVAPGAYDPAADGPALGRVLTAEPGRAVALVGVDEAAALRALVAGLRADRDRHRADVEALRAEVEAQREAAARLADRLARLEAALRPLAQAAD